MVSDESPAASDREIVLTYSARSKSHRMLSDYALRERVRGQSGAIHRRGESNEYHLVKNGLSVVVVAEEDQYVVITQMHDHPNYHQKVWQQVGELPSATHD